MLKPRWRAWLTARPSSSIVLAIAGFILLFSQQEFEIGAPFLFGKTQRLGQVEQDGTGLVQLLLGRLDLQFGEAPESLDLIQGDFNSASLSLQVKETAMLAHEGNRPIAEVLQQACKILSDSLSRAERYFD